MTPITDVPLAIQALVFFAAALGALVRTVMPYLQQFKAGAIVTFDKSYLVTFAVSAAESIVFVILIAVEIPVDLALSPLLMFTTSFAFAYTFNDIQNRVITPTTKPTITT